MPEQVRYDEEWHHCESTAIASGGHNSPVNGNHPAPNLVQFDRFEQRLKIAVAETLVPLALDDLEEDRPDHVLGEDFEQDAFVADIAVDQDAVDRKSTRLNSSH